MRLLTLAAIVGASILAPISSQAEPGIVKTKAKWTVIVYMAADNNLYPFALQNIQDMVKGLVKDSNDLNVLVQLDKPEDNKTWRYKITSQGAVEVASVNKEMGIDPVQDIIDCATWIINDYPAEHYAWILWNHGSGIQDIKNIGLFNCLERGILYDDSQGTLLTDQGMTDAFTKVNAILGQEIDVICMDACLMAMVEIAYQLNNLALVMVSSEQIEPGSGYPYAAIMAQLSANPASYDAKKLGTLIVNEYGNYYKKIGEKDFTSSAFNMSNLSTLKTNIENIVAKVHECKKYGDQIIKKAVIKARRNSLSFYTADFIDLYSFYSNLKLQLAAIVKTMSSKTSFAKAINSLIDSLDAGTKIITSSIIANAVGTSDSQAHGIAIYYLDPYKAADEIDESYLAALFAHQSTWLNFIKENRY